MNEYEVVLRLILAVVIGGAVGYEREFKNRPAGFRTNILVCLGAAVISMIQLYEVESTKNLILQHPEFTNIFKADIGRLDAQVVSGVGFLGAGTILHEKGSVKGLTTAATLWVVACIGLAVGLGYYYLSVLSTVAVVVSLVSLKRFETKFLIKKDLIKIEIEYVNRIEMSNSIIEYFDSKNIIMKNIEFALEDAEDLDEDCMKGFYTILVPKKVTANEIINDLGKKNGIIKVILV
ncbi:MgtC/SapB family protein [Clostridium thailandense]|uniref:MgtC/SapB family protein n=1 Tax=Clostridium thailandense TaxID=2794346 RepID=A0A949WTE7_9CLOT|nr:MgtC/SapB family protein [Clostridium thailandense]MBV7276245.1 MgtC/SapB family protein [Clostridium thailandense]